MFASLNQLFLRLTGGHRKQKKRRPSPKQRRTPEFRDDPSARFIRSVRRMKQSNPDFRDHLYIISMTDFRQAVGRKWSRLSDMVATLGSIVVKDTVGRQGMFCQADEQTFVITLPKDSREDARGKVVLIAQDLSTYLVGDRTINGQRPMILAANIPFDKAISTQGRFDVEALAQAVEESRSVAFVPEGSETQEGEEDPTVASLEVFRVGEANPPRRAARSAAVPGAEVEEKAAAAAPGEPGWDAVKHARSTGQTAEWQRIRARSAQGIVTRFPWEDPGPLASSSRLSVVWRPIWSARTEAVGIFSARILRFEESGKPPTEGSHAYPQRNPLDGLNIDRVIIAQTLRQLQTGSRIPVVVAPLSWVSVTTDHRRALLGPLADIAQTALRDRLIIEVVNLPDVPDKSQLDDMLNFLSNLGPSVMLRVRMVNALRLINAHLTNTLSLDFSELAPDERIGDSALLARLSELRAMTAHNGGDFAIWGIRRRALIAASAQAGFAMLNGPGLMGDLNAIKGVIPLPRKTLEEGLAAEKGGTHGAEVAEASA